MAWHVAGWYRLREGTEARFHSLMRRLAPSIRVQPAMTEFWTLSAEDDPSHVLLLGRYRERATAQPQRLYFSPEEEAEIQACIEGLVVPARWYQSVREAENLAERRLVVTALLLRVDPVHQAGLRQWARSVQPQLLQLPGLGATRLLVAADDPSQYLLVHELRDWTIRPQVLATLQSYPFPTLVYQRPVFLGELYYQTAASPAERAGRSSRRSTS